MSKTCYSGHHTQVIINGQKMSVEELFGKEKGIIAFIPVFKSIKAGIAYGNKREKLTLIKLIEG